MFDGLYHAIPPATMKRQLITLVWVMLLVTISGRAVRAQVSGQDSLALVALYNATDGPNWADNTNWLAGPVSTWFGITVSGDRVTRLDLRDNNLTKRNTDSDTGVQEGNGALTRDATIARPGEIQRAGPTGLGEREPADPTESILQADDLHEETSMGNGLLGFVPPEIGNLTALEYLKLSDNKLTGSIPTEIGNLTNLEYLSFTRNDLTGSIPSSLSNLTDLEILALVGNQFIGEIPSWLGSLTTLTELYLWGNQLEGAVLSELGNLTNRGVVINK